MNFSTQFFKINFKNVKLVAFLSEERKNEKKTNIEKKQQQNRQFQVLKRSYRLLLELNIHSLTV